MAHDFKRFPELTNSQMNFYYFDSPHKQITEDFHGKCVKVTDGDTIHVKWQEREKPIVVRMSEIAAPENKEKGGRESKNWLTNKILNDGVEIMLDEQRVEKWGRILGRVIHKGIDVNLEIIEAGHAVPFEEKGLADPITIFSRERRF